LKYASGVGPPIELLDDYRPPAWLRNGHLQSILPSLEPRRTIVVRNTRRLVSASRDVLVDCGDGVRLLGHYAPQPPATDAHPRDLVLMVHGWEGSAESIYVLSAGQYLHDRGYEVFRLNLRDHGPTHHLNSDLFHSCRIAEVVGAVRSVQEMFPARRLTMIGYSLGGNFTLRVAARAPANGIRLHQAIAVCPVLDPEATLESLENGLWIYRNYFVLKWRKSLLKKQRAWPDLYDLDELTSHRDLTRMTEHLILKYSEYPDLQSYLRGYAIVGDVLRGLEVPSRILASLDDPIIPASDLQRLAPSPNLRISATRFGGHCGFMESFGGLTWADRRLHAMVEAGPHGAERAGLDDVRTPEPAPEGPR
jgi:predicted alpha/beta-fold hydrolase